MAAKNRRGAAAVLDGGQCGNFGTSIMAMRGLFFFLSVSMALLARSQGGTDALRDADDKARAKWNEVGSGPKHAAPVDTTRIYSINDLEQLPEFPGGLQAMYAFIGEQFQYTDTARSTAPGGRIYVSFVVERSGAVDQVRVLRGISTALNAEAERVVAAMPPWTPGKYFGGTVVACRMTIPIKCQPK